MSDVIAHHVLMEKAENQPSDDHVTFISGNIDKELGMEVPFECLHLPLATWMSLGSPQKITMIVKPDDHLPR